LKLNTILRCFPIFHSCRRQHTVAAYATIAGLGDLTEHVDGYKCKLFDTSGFGIQTKFRTEHLNENEKSKFMATATAEEKPGVLKRILSYLSKYDIDRDSDESVSPFKI